MNPPPLYGFAYPDLPIMAGREAIVKALGMARRGDIVLIAGKGHENFQEMRSRVVPFDDRDIQAVDVMHSESLLECFPNLEALREQHHAGDGDEEDGVDAVFLTHTLEHLDEPVELPAG